MIFHSTSKSKHVTFGECRSLIGKVGQFVTTVRCTEATRCKRGTKLAPKFSQLPRSSCSRWQWGTYHWRTGSVRGAEIAKIWNHLHSKDLKRMCFIVLLFSCLIFYVYMIFVVFCERLTYIQRSSSLLPFQQNLF